MFTYRACKETVGSETVSLILAILRLEKLYEKKDHTTDLLFKVPLSNTDIIPHLHVFSSVLLLVTVATRGIVLSGPREAVSVVMD